MLADPDRAALEAAWTPARRAGVLGDASIEELWEHTAGFASAVCSAFSADCSTWNGTVLDAGTGAGVPGVLLAAQLPAATLTLVDALERRLGHARAAVRSVGLAPRVELEHGRLDDLGRSVAHRGRYDAVVARLLAEPTEAAELLAPLARAGGILVVSARPDQVESWRSAAAQLTGGSDISTTSTDAGLFVTVTVPQLVDDRYPRRPAARRRHPLT